MSWICDKLPQLNAYWLELTSICGGHSEMKDNKIKVNEAVVIRV